MRVLFVTWEYPPSSAGVGRYVQQMAFALRSIGHEPFVFCGSQNGNEVVEEAPEGLVLRYYNEGEIGTKQWVKKLQRVIEKHQIDIVEGADHWGECAAYIKTSLRKPVVIKAHSSNALKALRESNIIYGWQRPMVFLARMRKARRFFDEAFCITNADLLLAPSQRIVDEYKKQGIRLPEKNYIFPNPITPPEGWTNKEATQPTLLLVGRVDAGKGIQYLPSFLEKLVKRCPAVRIELAGKDTFARGIGSMSSWLKRKSAAYSDKIFFLGQLDDILLDEAYRRAWVVIVPSRWDNFPTVVLEAMARRKAIVASPNGGMPEMLSNTSCVIADPSQDGFADSVATLINNKNLRLEAGETAFNKATTVYSPEKIARQYIDMMEKYL